MGDEQSGRALVRERLVQRLEEAGLQRNKKLSPDGHKRLQTHLCNTLDYMSPENLDILAQELLDRAVKTGRWITELEIRQIAFGLQERPWSEAAIVKSWLSSIEGPKAEAGDYLTELYLWMRKSMRPVSPFDLREIKERAAQRRRNVERWSEKQARGLALEPWERAELEQYRQNTERARLFVSQGQAKRERQRQEAAREEAARHAAETVEAAE